MARIWYDEEDTIVEIAEAVRRGHPDSMAGQIADAILRYILLNAPEEEREELATRAAPEIGLYTDDFVVIGGEITTRAKYDPVQIAREVIRDIGYRHRRMGLSPNVKPVIKIKKQSPDIKRGVDSLVVENVGAGDQGIMVGYASNETPELMPAPFMLAQKLVMKPDELMRNPEFKWLRPDGKAEVILTQDGRTYKPIRAEKVVVSVQHEPWIKQGRIYESVLEQIIKPTLGKLYKAGRTKVYVNPTGRFVRGGPQSDTGFTGRKIVAVAYGPRVPVGGGSFDGKDPTKVDRSGAYAARFIAKNIVGAGLADRCDVKIAYAIGVADPLALVVCTYGTGKLDGKYLQGRRLKKFEKILGMVAREIFPVKPGAIITQLGLLDIPYDILSRYGHFGRRDILVPWELTPMKASLYDAVNRAMRRH